MKLKLIAVGRLKETYFREAEEFYQKRLAIEIIEINQTNKEREGEGILRRIGGQDRVCALSPGGRPFQNDTIRRMIEEAKDLTFVIGGSLGLGENVLRRADCILSFSRMTFPHQLARLILLEMLCVC